MAIPTVTLDDLIEPEWGNAVAAAIAALESADSAIQAALGVITANGWVTSARIADGQVTEAKLASDSVTAAKIAAGAVNTSELANGSVTTAKIADGGVTNAKLASGISASKITTGSMSGARLTDGTITGAKLADTGWTVYQGGRFACVFMGGFVLCSGVVESTSNTTSPFGVITSSPIATQFRPSGNRYLPVGSVDDTTHRNILRIQPNGEVWLLGGVSFGDNYVFSGVYDV